jgi:DNA-binding GntR family transcriptional regulator
MKQSRLQSISRSVRKNLARRGSEPSNRSGETGRADRSADRGPSRAEGRLYDDLIGAIVDQRLRAGTRLNEMQLAKAYRLARPRVRSALNRLAANNIVEIKLNLGAFIRRPSPSEAKAVYEARRFLEAGVIQTIARRPANRDLKRLRDLVALEKKAYVQPKPGVHRLSSEFHVILADAAGNPVMKDILVRLIHQCCLIQSLYLTAAGPPCLTHDHEELIECLARGSLRQALRIHNRHFDQIEGSLMLEAYRGELDGVSAAFSEFAA